MDAVDSALSLLDRQVEALAGQEGPVEFLISVEPFLHALRSDPRIAIHLEDLRDEAIDRVRVLEEVDSELVPELVQLRRRLVELRVDLDDSATPRPDLGEDDRAWVDSLARFDALAETEPQPLNYRGDGARTPQLLQILENETSAPGRRPSAALESWAVDLHNARRLHDHRGILRRVPPRRPALPPTRVRPGRGLSRLLHAR